MTLTAIILTYNEEKHIRECIDSLAWADRVVVFDSVSEDETVALAEAAGATTHQHPFQNYAQQRNAALDAIKDEPADWVLFIDADERGTAELGAEIRQVMESGTDAGYYIPRHNFIFGNLTLGAGWWPDYQQRLFRYGRVRYERPVHEVAVLEGDGTSGYLESPLIHYNYETVEQFHAKQKKYTTYEARVLREGGIRPKFYTPFTQPVRHFIWRFITLNGYKLGWHGFRLSCIMAYYEWRKYRAL